MSQPEIDIGQDLEMRPRVTLLLVHRLTGAVEVVVPTGVAVETATHARGRAHTRPTGPAVADTRADVLPGGVGTVNRLFTIEGVARV